MQPILRFSLAALSLALLVAAPALACPFCSAVSQTFTEEIATMDVAVIAKLVKAPPPTEKAGDEIQKATFEITQVLKGDGLVKPGEKIDTLYFGDGTLGKPFLVMGIDPPKVMWSTPLPVTDRAIKYLSEVLKLPKEDADRLVFFQSYLEDADEMLARDAYDEFARAPYSQVKTIKDKMNHQQVVAWIKNPDVPASRRRLYLVMLGVCGSEKDIPMLEEFMKSSDRKAKSGLDALIACYMTLKGESGLPLVEQLFLANDKADYADTYAAIMAIRFHGTEGGIIEPKRLVKALHHMLQRPELADLVIPDLAKWEDWSVMDKLFDLYKTASEKNSWVRVPVINYLRACPLPKAKELLTECEKIDPAAVKRANSFFPASPATPTPPAGKATKAEGSNEPAAIAVAAPEGGAIASRGTKDGLVAAVNQGVELAEAARKTPAPPANLWALLGVPWAIGMVLFALQWSILRGGAK
jgi:hypothetical protein